MAFVVALVYLPVPSTSPERAVVSPCIQIIDSSFAKSLRQNSGGALRARPFASLPFVSRAVPSVGIGRSLRNYCTCRSENVNETRGQRERQIRTGWIAEGTEMSRKNLEQSSKNALSFRRFLRGQFVRDRRRIPLPNSIRPLQSSTEFPSTSMKLAPLTIRRLSFDRECYGGIRSRIISPFDSVGLCSFPASRDNYDDNGDDGRDIPRRRKR